MKFWLLGFFGRKSQVFPEKKTWNEPRDVKFFIFRQSSAVLDMFWIFVNITFLIVPWLGLGR